MTVAKRKTLLPPSPYGSNKQSDLLSFDKGIHKNRVTDTQRIIRKRKKEKWKQQRDWWERRIPLKQMETALSALPTLLPYCRYPSLSLSFSLSLSLSLWFQNLKQCVGLCEGLQFITIRGKQSRGVASTQR